METKEALRLISEKIDAGQSKSSIYKELLPEMAFKDELVRCLSGVADLEGKNSNKKRNFAVQVLLAYTLITNFLGGIVALYGMPPSVVIIESLTIIFGLFFIGFTMVEVGKYRFNGYVFAAMVALWSLQPIDGASLFQLLSKASAIIMAVLSFVVAKDLFPWRFKSYIFDDEKYEREYLNIQE